jgi:hypothetical protein
LEAFRKAVARSTNEKRKLFRELGQVLLDDEIADPDVRTVSFARVPKKVLHEAMEETQGLIRPRPDDAIDFFGKRSSYTLHAYRFHFYAYPYPAKILTTSRVHREG